MRSSDWMMNRDHARGEEDDDNFVPEKGGERIALYPRKSPYFD